MSDEALYGLLSQQSRGVLVAIRPNGRPHLSNVVHHYDPDRRLIRVSITATRAKTGYLREDPRASYHVATPDFWQWAVADGTAELIPVAHAVDDATVEDLVDLYRRIRGADHDDWPGYRRAMVEEQRLVLHLHVERIYGQTRG
ncbi:MAG: PPOX class F420-dependent oxidoreductase [Actinobacteria bacterium]|nr:PPOX class F420-dependent oxidoreductase [Actinomycetota bacterium]